MSKNPKSPFQSLNNTFRRMPVLASDITRFTNHLSSLISNVNENESEEFAKGQLTQFLNACFYQGKNKINTKGRIDLAIYDEKNPVVILECKRPKLNDQDMVTLTNLNAKSLHELILYYLRERLDHNNTNIKHLIITNIYEWFVFDERDFDKIIYSNTKLKKDYETFRNEKKDTEHFYKSIAKIFLEKENPQFDFTYFDLRLYKKYLIRQEEVKTEQEIENRSKLRALYKFLSPQHLLKQQLANDSNSLNKDFYYELLHIIGLEEVKKEGKKLIQRKSKGQQNEGSLLENVIFNLEQTDRLRKLKNPSSFGETQDQQKFSVALELCISWIDRILFLKLLEQQLVRYHKSEEYLFLNTKKIPDFDALRNVFFSVLAKKPGDRQGKWKLLFEKTPYLNSSLFEPNSLEDDVMGIESLDSHLELDIFKGTKILLDNKPAKGKISTLSYLFKFLDAYNFASEGADEEQRDRKTLINAAVLGLIFEKINGYKDGSFFTPGFITMYMCRETLRRCVLDKFNERYEWKCEALEDIYNHLKRNTKDILEYNELINDLKICDPAVGSGHFLVSALNELIAIKSELGILADHTGKTLPIKISIENDELMVIYGDKIYEYSTPASENEIQRIQKALFHEKEIIIEHCLFGVDINGNSVKICRLRLWIELLKNSYYTQESNYKELETLPNIDINIKRGNSLMNRFTLDSDLSTVFKQQKFNYGTYRLAVESYKTAPSKKAKQELLDFINEIKEQFKTVFYSHDPLQKRLNLLQGQRLLLNESIDLFGKKIRDEKEVKTEKKRLDILIAQIEQKIQNLKDNKNYINAFEWRFEFPEVMNKKGDFIGFDIILGNPPYGVMIDSDAPTSESYLLFFARALEILKDNGFLCFIAPESWLINDNAAFIRKKFTTEGSVFQIRDVYKVFDDAPDVWCNLTFFQKSKQHVNLEIKRDFPYDLDFFQFKTEWKRYKELGDKRWFVNINSKFRDIFSNVDNCAKLSDFVEINRGYSPTPNSQNITTTETMRQVIGGEDFGRYITKIKPKYLVNAYTKSDDSIRNTIKKDFIGIQRIRTNSLDFHSKWIVSQYFLKGYVPIDSISYVTTTSNLDLKYVLAILNSKLINFYYKFHYTDKNVKPIFLKEIGIPELSQQEQAQFIVLVEEIIQIKNLDISIDTTKLENKIDALVYKSYGLSDEEIFIIESI